MDPVSTLIMIGLLSACAHASKPSKKSATQRHSDAHLSDQGWGSFEPNEFGCDDYDGYGDQGDYGDYGF